MAHSHLGCQSPTEYFTEQLLTILVCGALGFVGSSLYMSGLLSNFLAPQFHLPVFIGSVAVLALVVVRAVVVWREAGALQPVDDAMTCQVNHVHTAACNHALPGLPTGTEADATVVDDHGHSHDMAWVVTRMLILVFPVLLFAFGILNTGLSAEWVKKKAQLAGPDVALDPEQLKKLAADATLLEERQEGSAKVRVLQTKSGMKIREVTLASGEVKYIPVPEAGEVMQFNTLNDAAFDAEKRKHLAGQTAIMEGRFQRLGDKEFTLLRMKMTCCGADAVPLKVRIITPYAINNIPDYQWVRVKGVVQFVKAPGQDRYTPLLVVDNADVDPNVPVRNEFEF